MIEVKLQIDEWNRVLAILAQAPWQQANPLIMAIANQLQAAQGIRPNGADPEPRPETTRQ